MLPLLLPEVHSAPARSRFNRWNVTGVRCIAPALYAAEAASALRRQINTGRLTLPVAAHGLGFLMSAVSVRAEDHLLALRALEIACSIGAGRAYDSMYAALAERVACELWTGDQRFYNAARRVLPFVRWAGEPAT
jgi:predicted nucleic acid-binding protein